MAPKLSILGMRLKSHPKGLHTTTFTNGCLLVACFQSSRLLLAIHRQITNTSSLLGQVQWRVRFGTPLFFIYHIYLHLGVSINAATPIAGWFIEENPNLKWMTTRGTPICGDLHISYFRVPSGKLT